MKYLLNTVQYLQYFAWKYLKRTFEKQPHEIGPIDQGPGMKYSLNTVQYVQYFAPNHLKRTCEKSHMK